MELDLSLTEVNLILQLARDSRALIARFTAVKTAPLHKGVTTPVHDEVIAKCERVLFEVESRHYPNTLYSTLCATGSVTTRARTTSACGPACSTAEEREDPPDREEAAT